MVDSRRLFWVPVLSLRLARRHLRHLGLSGKAVSVPLFIVSLGVSWLVDTLGITPTVTWVWIICLGAPGILLLAFGRWHRINCVLGATFAIASGFSLLQQTGRISGDVVAPCLLIAFGALMLFVRLTQVPLPRWMKDPQNQT